MNQKNPKNSDWFVIKPIWKINKIFRGGSYKFDTVWSATGETLVNIITLPDNLHCLNCKFQEEESICRISMKIIIFCECYNWYYVRNLVGCSSWPLNACQSWYLEKLNLFTLFQLKNFWTIWTILVEDYPGTIPVEFGQITKSGSR